MIVYYYFWCNQNYWIKINLKQHDPFAQKTTQSDPHDSDLFWPDLIPIQSDLTWSNTTWSDLTCSDLTWSDSTRTDPTWSDLIWLDIRPNLTWSDLIWSDLTQFDLIVKLWLDLIWSILCPKIIFTTPHGILHSTLNRVGCHNLFCKLWSAIIHVYSAFWIFD